MQRVLQQLYDLGRPGAAAILRPRTPEDLFRKGPKLEWDAELATIAGREAQVLASEVHRETDVVAAVQNQLALGLMDEAGPGARLDCREHLRKVEAGTPGEHQCLARGDQVDEREHVGDHLEHASLTQLPQVER